MHLIARQLISPSQQIEGEITFAPKSVSVVIHTEGAVLGVFATIESSPDQPVGAGIVGGRLSPAYHLDGVESARTPVLVRFLRAFPQIGQKRVRLPILGLVIFHVAGLD